MNSKGAAGKRDKGKDTNSKASSSLIFKDKNMLTNIEDHREYQQAWENKYSSCKRNKYIQEMCVFPFKFYIMIHKRNRN